MVLTETSLECIRLKTIVYMVLIKVFFSFITLHHHDSRISASRVGARRDSWREQNPRAYYK